jgi:hypothetical protein
MSLERRNLMHSKPCAVREDREMRGSRAAFSGRGACTESSSEQRDSRGFSVTSSR